MPAFEQMEYDYRLHRTRLAMQRRELDILLVTTPMNQYYLTGAYSTASPIRVLIVTLDRDPIYLVDRQAAEDVSTQIWMQDLCSYGDEDPCIALRDKLQELGFHHGRLGLEVQALPFPLYERIASALSGFSLEPVGGLIEELRLIKSARELELMYRAARLCNIGLQVGIESIQEGASEAEVAAAVVSAQIRQGQDTEAALVSIRSGPNSSLQYVGHRNRRMQRGEQVTLEIAGSWKRYSTNVSRTLFVGDAEAQWLHVLDLANESYRRAVAALRPGVPVSRIDEAAREPMEDAGYTPYLSHQSGYNSGIYVRSLTGPDPELNLLAQGSRLLEPGVTLSLQVGFYRSGMGGIQIADSFLVTDTGVEYMTTPHHGVIRR